MEHSEYGLSKAYVDGVKALLLTLRNEGCDFYPSITIPLYKPRESNYELEATLTDGGDVQYTLYKVLCNGERLLEMQKRPAPFGSWMHRGNGIIIKEV